MLWLLTTILALLMIFLIPGFALVKAVFPREGELDSDYNLLYSIILGSVLSIAIFIFNGFALNWASDGPETGVGYFQSEYIWASLLILTAFFFAAGWYRGAYPSLGRIHPKLARMPPVGRQSILIYPRKERELVLERRRLAKEMHDLGRDIKKLDRMVKASSGETRDELARERKVKYSALKMKDSRLQEIENILLDSRI